MFSLNARLWAAAFINAGMYYWFLWIIIGRGI